jgi:tRNA pseudouridine38-40 synthase
VHAWGQVASFETTAAPAPEELGRALNGLTAEDVAILGVVEANGFNARRDALSRTYCYRVLAGQLPSPFERGLSLYWPHPVELDSLRGCATAVAGAHDFTAFTPTQTEHVRFERDILNCEWRQGASIIGGGGEGRLLELWIEADAFMRNMVRVLVGTMLEVAAGRRSLEDFIGLLEGAPRERAGDTAQAHGLYLASVRYKGLREP